MNLRPLEFYLNLIDITQVKKTVTFLQGSEAVMNVNDSTLVELTTGILVDGLNCHVSPEPTHMFTPWLTSGMTDFLGKRTHAQARSASHTGFDLVGRMGASIFGI